MMEPTDIDIVFASTVSLLRVLHGFDKQILDIRELQHQTRALCTVLLLLINDTDRIVDDQLKQPLLRCGEGCDYLKKLMTESTEGAENLDYWRGIFRNTRHMLSTYTSTFLIGFAAEIL
jgi:hypothetical protein